MKKLQKKLQLLSLLLVAGLLFSSVTIPVRAFIQKQGTVNEAVTLRQNPNNNANQVMELSNGQAVTVNNELTGEDGATWYQIFVNGTTLGYVPAKTVTISSGSSTGTTSGSANSNTGTTTTIQTVTVTEKVGKVTANSAVRVRAQATTSSDQVASMQPNATFSVLNDVNGSDGYVWHQIEFDDNGTQVKGYVRSDLVAVETITREEQIEVEVPAITEPSESTTAEAPYSLTSQVNAEGTTVWYLVDNNTGDAKEITTLLTPQETKSGNGVYKVIVVILLILLILAAAAATFFYMRWQDAEDFICELREKQVRAKKQMSQPTHTVTQKQQPATKQAPISKQSQTVNELVSKAVAKVTPNAAAKPAATTEPAVKQPAQATVAPTPAAKPAAAPAPESKPVAQSTTASFTAEKIKQDDLPKTSDIVKTTKQELQNKQTKTADANASNGWKSKNFLTEDDDLEFDFLDIDEK